MKTTEKPTHTKFGGLIDHVNGGCCLASGRKTTDTPCPRDGELVNVRCWRCRWQRDPEERAATIRNHGGEA